MGLFVRVKTLKPLPYLGGHYPANIYLAMDEANALRLVKEGAVRIITDQTIFSGAGTRAPRPCQTFKTYEPEQSGIFK
jgi:hypothetical protein